jgi:RNase H-fold protein (predicted Holliday junction resolvase)
LAKIENLKKGLQFLNGNTPLGKMDMKELTAKLDYITNATLDGAMNGSEEDCFSILNILYDVYDLCQGKPVLKTQGSEKTLVDGSSIEEVNKEYVENEIKDANYTPEERTFRPMVRWILHKGIEWSNKYEMEEAFISRLNSYLDICSSKVFDILIQITNKIPDAVINLICSSKLYQLADEFILGSKGANEDDVYLDHLIKIGSLNVQTHMLSSIKEMSHETSPFYESIHINIISAFMDSINRKLELDHIVEHLQKCFEFDSDLNYPYDIEDGFLIWVGHCYKALKNSKKYGELVNGLNLDDIDDLSKELASGWLILCIMCSYFDQHSYCRDVVFNPNNDEKKQNFELIQKLINECDIDIFVTWLPLDMVGTNTSSSRKMNSGNALHLYIEFLHSLFRIVFERDLKFTVDQNEDELEEKNASKDDSNVQEVLEESLEDAEHFIKNEAEKQPVTPVEVYESEYIVDAVKECTKCYSTNGNEDEAIPSKMSYTNCNEDVLIPRIASSCNEDDQTCPSSKIDDVGNERQNIISVNEKSGLLRKQNKISNMEV